MPPSAPSIAGSRSTKAGAGSPEKTTSSVTPTNPAAWLNTSTVRTAYLRAWMPPRKSADPHEIAEANASRMAPRKAGDPHGDREANCEQDGGHGAGWWQAPPKRPG